MALILFLQSSLRSSLRSDIAPDPYLMKISKFSQADRICSYSRNRCGKVAGFGGMTNPSAPGNDLHPGILSSVGVPTSSKII